MGNSQTSALSTHLNSFAAIIKLIRVKQWIKNGFLFLPMFFDNQLFNTDTLINTSIAFFSFSFFASTIYVLNDYMDIEKDRLHPTKRNRPLAAGIISRKFSLVLMLGLVTIAIGLGLLVPHKYFIFAGSYVILNLFYTTRLKHIPILDITMISVGFVLRVFAGASVGAITPSEWLIMMTFLLALFLALAKRRDDVLIFNESGTKTRSVVDGYNLQFVNIAMSIMASVIIVAYLMYALSPEVEAKLQTEHLYISVFFVILGILRYLQLTLVEENSGSPTELVYDDLFLKLTIAGWVITIGIMLYFL